MEETGVRMQEVGYRRKDTGGSVQEGWSKGRIHGRVQEEGDIERRRKDDTRGRRKM
jgi:hypothetical protein